MYVTINMLLIFIINLEEDNEIMEKTKKEIDLNAPYDPNKVKVIETRENPDDPKSKVIKIEVEIDGKKTDVVPITQLAKVKGSKDIYISTLNTCKSKLYVHSYLGTNNGHDKNDIENQWRGNPSSRVKKMLTDEYPMDIIKSFNPIISINLVGKEDWDAVDIDTDNGNNLLIQFAKGTMYENCSFPINRPICGKVTHIPVLIENGSGNRYRHALDTEKKLIQNTVNLFKQLDPNAITITKINEQIPIFIDQLKPNLDKIPDNENQKILLFEAGPEPNVRGEKTQLANDIEKLLTDNFGAIIKNFAPRMVLNDYDNSFIAPFSSLPEAIVYYSADGKQEFISNWSKEFLYNSLSRQILSPFDLDKDKYKFKFEKTDSQILDKQMDPLHYLQCAFYAFMLQNLSKEAPERKKILKNIFDLIRFLENFDPDSNLSKLLSIVDYTSKFKSELEAKFLSNADFVNSMCTPLGFIFYSISADQITPNDLSKFNSFCSMVEDLYFLVSNAEHVTQFNLVQIDPERTFANGFLLPNGVFVIPYEILRLKAIKLYPPITPEEIERACSNGTLGEIIDNLEPEEIQFIPHKAITLPIIQRLAKRDYVQYLQMHYITDTKIINAIIPHLHQKKELVQALKWYEFDSQSYDLLIQHNCVSLLSQKQLNSNYLIENIDKILPHLTTYQINLLYTPFIKQIMDHFEGQTPDPLQTFFLALEPLHIIKIEICYPGKLKAYMDKSSLDSNIKQLILSQVQNLPQQIEFTKDEIYFAGRADISDRIIPYLKPEQIPVISAAELTPPIIELLVANRLIVYLSQHQINSFEFIQSIRSFSREQISSWDIDNNLKQLFLSLLPNPQISRTTSLNHISIFDRFFLAYARATEPNQQSQNSHWDNTSPEHER